LSHFAKFAVSRKEDDKTNISRKKSSIRQYVAILIDLTLLDKADPIPVRKITSAEVKTRLNAEVNEVPRKKQYPEKKGDCFPELFHLQTQLVNL
jgi:hypothetical protein